MSHPSAHLKCLPWIIFLAAIKVTAVMAAAVLLAVSVIVCLALGAGLIAWATGLSSSWSSSLSVLVFIWLVSVVMKAYLDWDEQR